MEARQHRISAAMRDGEQVTPLELFFDLVFVLALTQCTSLMAAEPHWYGLAKGLLVLGVLWWAWVGYSWLTSVIDPEEGAVRLFIFASMGAFLICSLCIPEAFEGLALTFALFYAAVRIAQMGLFWIASQDEPALRRSIITGLLGTTLAGVGLLVVASALDGPAQGACWALAIGIDIAGPQLFGSEGWKLSPQHFAERHGLIIIIALGESIVAIGVGAEFNVTPGVVSAALFGVTLAAMMWWAYFDVVAKVPTRRLVRAEVGREQNELARDAFSYIHFLMVAGIVLVAFGLKETLAHVSEPLDTVPAVALLGGIALYLLAHVAMRWRSVHTLNRRRLGVAIVLFAAIPLGTRIDAGATLAIATILMCGMIAFDTWRYGEARTRLRHESAAEES